MIHTFDFINEVWKSETLKNELLSNMTEEKEANMIIGIHALDFDFKRQMISISCHDPSYFFRHKLIPAELSFEAMTQLIHHQQDFIYHLL